MALNFLNDNFIVTILMYVVSQNQHFWGLALRNQIVYTCIGPNSLFSSIGKIRSRWVSKEFAKASSSWGIFWLQWWWLWRPLVSRSWFPCKIKTMCLNSEKVSGNRQTYHPSDVHVEKGSIAFKSHKGQEHHRDREQEQKSRHFVLTDVCGLIRQKQGS